MQDQDLAALLRRMRRAFQKSPENFQSFDRDRQLGWGCETLREGANYHWDGEKRGISPSQPRVLFQYTLGGRGEYAEGGKLFSLSPGFGFTAVLPSAHAYYLPEGSPHWSFFWFMARHPFVSERIKELRRDEAAVQAWQSGSPALEAAATLFEAACQEKLREVWSFEERLFAWLLETERELDHRRYPQDERQQLLDETRQLLRQRLTSPPSASELADRHHLERTTFSRKFKATTGISPAAFVTEVRLEEALKLLRTEAKLEEVAASTGFADANHFCKVFKRHFHTSPGAYRQLMLKR